MSTSTARHFRKTALCSIFALTIGATLSTNAAADVPVYIKNWNSNVSSVYVVSNTGIHYCVTAVPTGGTVVYAGYDFETNVQFTVIPTTAPICERIGWINGLSKTFTLHDYRKVRPGFIEITNTYTRVIQ
ncbi:hypothetical protein [Xanthomonas sp. MUS 060]|uniref:hypothetical protein n=1 Tax=Xanthomonas sp. MUS 060 TaxID=1588031 RepID=UPI0005F2CDB8|nr:hypothetical protein [Xanthomonas sp. MUS 060]